MDQFCGGNWNMIATMATHSNPTTPSNQDHLYLQQQQQFHQQQQFQVSDFSTTATDFTISGFAFPPPKRLVENLGDAIENGTRDQHILLHWVTELSSHFEKCRQLLNTISGSIATKAAMVEGQKRKVDEAEQMLNQRRELIAKYRNSVEELAKSDL
ncbi:hypothetical protein Lser_V15G25303 [Lactuca serriola]